jgi:UDPglucose--hexose-1-phosphate uridylyltransferase
VNCRREQVRLMLQITSPRRAADKLKYLAGSEAAMGAWVGDISPELSAQNMREAIKRADAQNPVGTLPKCIKGIENKMTKMNNGMNK